MIRILVVDDEQETAWSIGKILEYGLGEDFSIQVLTSGRKAAQYLKEQKVDILLTDINMPGIDGFELLKMAQEGNQETQVIFLTGYQRFDYVYKASQNKGVRFLVKAETEEAIVHCVKDAVQEIQERKYQEKMLEIARRQLESSRYLVQETDNPPDGWLERVCQYIQAHIEDDISVSSVADAFHFHPTHLSRVFRNASGVTLSAYLLQKKLERAKYYLLQTDLSIQEISGRLGYQSTQAFDRVFKRETGMKPLEFRRSFAIGAF